MLEFGSIANKTFHNPEAGMDAHSLFDSYHTLEVEELSLGEKSPELPDAPIHTARQSVLWQDPNQEKSIFDRYLQARKFSETGTPA